MFRVNRVFIKNNCSFTSVLIRNKSIWTSEKVVKSPFEDVVVPDMTLNDFIWRNLDRWPTKTAVVCGITKRAYTYEQAFKQSQILGANLRKRFKVENGDAVAVMMPNNPEYPIVVTGILAAGGIVTTLNPVYTAYEVQKQIIVSDTKLIIAHPNVVPVVKEALRQCKKELSIIVVNMTEDLPEGTIAYKELVQDNHVDLSVLKDVKRNANDVSMLPYSSGTTGFPKGVELTNRNIVANFEQQNTDCRLYSFTTESNQDSALVILPMFHTYGLALIALHKLSAGLKLVTLPNFNPETCLNSLVEFKINLLFLAPPIVLYLASHPQVTSKHLEHVRISITGAAPTPSADMEKFMDKLKPDTHFAQGYGMTETSPLATICPMGYKNLSSVGLPLPNVELRVVDNDLKNLGPNEVGELLIKGPNVMKGYKNNDEANKEAFGENGWFRSGDMARIDETGAVYIADRLKELIKVKGYQVPPAELESVLKEHPAIFDAAVVGIPDPVTGEKPKGFVVLKDGHSVNGDDIKNFVSERVAPFKRIKEILFVDNIPKNPSGKILRRVLKEKYC